MDVFILQGKQGQGEEGIYKVYIQAMPLGSGATGFYFIFFP